MISEQECHTIAKKIADDNISIQMYPYTHKKVIEEIVAALLSVRNEHGKVTA